MTKLLGKAYKVRNYIRQDHERNKRFVHVSVDIQKLLSIWPTDEINAFKRDKLAYIIHLISAIPANNKNLICNGYVPIYSVILQSRIHNYLQYLEYLINAEVLECNNSYQVGKRSKGYRFTDQYKSSNCIEEEIQDYTLIKSIEKHDKQKKLSLKDHNFLTKHFYSGFLEIDFEIANRFILDERRKNNENPKFNENSFGIKRFKSPEQQYYYAMLCIEKIKSKVYSLSVDTNVGRFHSNLTNFPSKLRNALTYNNENLVSIDIKNSQPYLSIALLTGQIFNMDNKESGNKFNGFNTIINEIFKTKIERENYIMLVDSYETIYHKGFENYIDVVSKGELYELLKEEIYGEFGTFLSDRKELKAVVFKTLFTSNCYYAQDSAKYKRLFCRVFPEVYNVFKTIKRHGKDKLPRLLQIIESHLVINCIAKRISKERPGLPIFTIHDSIVTTCGNEEYIKKIMEDELTKFIGQPPTLQFEYWRIENLNLDNMDAA